MTLPWRRNDIWATAQEAISESLPREQVIIGSAVMMTDWPNKVEVKLANVHLRVICEERTAAKSAETACHSLPRRTVLVVRCHEPLRMGD